MALIHAHIDWESRDCDGLMSGSYVMELPEGAEADLLDGLAFRSEVMSFVVNTIATIGALTITDGDLEFREDTEEGFSRKSATFCTEDGCDTRSTRRDHQAEAAGY